MSGTFLVDTALGCPKSTLETYLISSLPDPGLGPWFMLWSKFPKKSFGQRYQEPESDSQSELC